LQWAHRKQAHAQADQRVHEPAKTDHPQDQAPGEAGQLGQPVVDRRDQARAALARALEGDDLEAADARERSLELGGVGEAAADQAAQLVVDELDPVQPPRVNGRLDDLDMPLDTAQLLTQVQWTVVHKIGPSMSDPQLPLPFQTEVMSFSPGFMQLVSPSQRPQTLPQVPAHSPTAS